MASQGHNSTDAKLCSLVERIETLAADKQNLNEDIKDIFTEAKAGGYDTKALREVIRLRKMDGGTRRERDALVAEYFAALGESLL